MIREEKMVTWENILGHEENISRLKLMLEENRLPHALLFYGLEGIGKRQVAKALAAALLCDEKNICGRCPSCLAMKSGNHPDFYEIVPEIRGKSSRIIRIETIREMEKETARLPVLSKCRVVIIDDADTMNESAQNALLKTLEEPTGEMYFILVTSVRDSLLNTIISRSIPFSFKPLETGLIFKALEKDNIMPEEAKKIASLADGSLGRAYYLANEGIELRDDAAKFLLSLDTMPKDNLFELGKNLGDLTKEKLGEWLFFLLLILRDELALYEGGTFIYNADLRSNLTKNIELFSRKRLFSLIKLVIEQQRRLNANVNLRLLAEAFIIKAQNTK